MAAPAKKQRVSESKALDVVCAFGQSRISKRLQSLRDKLKEKINTADEEKLMAIDGILCGEQSQKPSGKKLPRQVKTWGGVHPVTVPDYLYRDCLHAVTLVTTAFLKLLKKEVLTTLFLWSIAKEEDDLIPEPKCFHTVLIKTFEHEYELHGKRLQGVDLKGILDCTFTIGEYRLAQSDENSDVFDEVLQTSTQQRAKLVLNKVPLTIKALDAGDGKDWHIKDNYTVSSACLVGTSEGQTLKLMKLFPKSLDAKPAVAPTVVTEVPNKDGSDAASSGGAGLLQQWQQRDQLSADLEHQMDQDAVAPVDSGAEDEAAAPSSQQ